MVVVVVAVVAAAAAVVVVVIVVVFQWKIQALIWSSVTPFVLLI